MGSSESTSAESQDECYINNEMFCQASGEPISVEKLISKKNSICLIQVSSNNSSWTGTGFFIEFPFPSIDNPISGIMTNNHVLGAKQLVSGSKFTIVADSTNKSFTINLNDNLFLFTSELIDITFIQLSPHMIREINPTFLYASDSDSQKDDRITVLQHPKGGELLFSQGTIVSFWGCDYLHRCSTEYGSSGSPLLNHNFEVVGVHKRRRQSENANVATRISVIVGAIKTMYNQYVENKSIRGRNPAKTLNSTDIDVLNEHGLKPTEMDNLFISPASKGVTALFFFRTNHAWYWTPHVSVRHTLDDLKECNWSIIIKHREKKAIGGPWDGEEPASRNIRLIEWLWEKGLDYL